MAKSRGRRPAQDAVSREAVLAVAREQFASRGYATTIRSVAKEAGVDPALVMYQHGSKRDLFLAAVATPFDSAPVVAELAAGDRASVGRRLIEFLLAVLAIPEQRSVFLARSRAAATEPEAAALVRELIANDLVGPLVRRLGSDQPRRRAALVSTQLFGYVMVRWILEVPALGTPITDTADALGPVLQRYLVDPL